MLQELSRVVGAEHVRTDESSCVLYAQDVYTRGLPALAVVSPGSTQELSDVIRTAAAAGHAVIARGGGMSYTSGYVPTEPGSVIVDTQRMDEVLEVNAEDMYVTVQAGCTWRKLYERLQGSGLRTPFWGTLSGIHATVGGGVSQNSIFWGSGKYGTAVDSVVSLDVVLADGRVVTTGAAATQDGAPFFRHYGPDLSGLFACDAGSLGIKATVTLRLIPETPHRLGLSFDFGDYASLIEAMSDVSRSGLADECFAFDPNLQTVRMQRESLMSDVKKLAGVLKSAGSIAGAIKDGARVAVAGRGFMKGVQYSLHVLIEDRLQGPAKAAATDIRAICEARGGVEIENSIPTILRANPFTPLNNMVGPNGERWVPVHTIVPHSKAKATLDAVTELFAENDAEMERHGIGYGFLLATVAHNGFVVEPVFFTPDELNEIHKATVEPGVLKKLPGFDANPEAREATARIRGELIRVFRENGGIHMQIGKSYPYKDSLRPESWRLVEAVKEAVDPEKRINPGALGLD